MDARFPESELGLSLPIFSSSVNLEEKWNGNWPWGEGRFGFQAVTVSYAAWRHELLRQSAASVSCSFRKYEGSSMDTRTRGRENTFKGKNRTTRPRRGILGIIPDEIIKGAVFRLENIRDRLETEGSTERNDSAIQLTVLTSPYRLEGSQRWNCRTTKPRANGLKFSAAVPKGT